MTRRVALFDRSALPAATRAALARELAGCPTLGDVLDWARRRRPPAAVEAIVTQDEYTHDVLIPLDAPRYAVFDVT